MLVAKSKADSPNHRPNELPISTIHSKKQIKKKITPTQGSVLTLTFKDRVVYTAEKLSYSFFDVLVDIGSSLGLWFGISALDLATSIGSGLKDLRTQSARTSKKL